MMHHLPGEFRLQAAREMRRVLRARGRLLLADFKIPERGALRLVASITGHDGDTRRRRVRPLEALVAEADFTEVRSGDAPPWLHYVSAIKGSSLRAARPAGYGRDSPASASAR